jgi:hypothetical protein
MARGGSWFERILARSSIAVRDATLDGSRLSHIDQQRLATVLGPAYWQNLQCIFVRTIMESQQRTRDHSP